MVLEKIRQSLAAQFERDVGEISAATNIVDDLGADSLDLVELVSELETEYGITVTDESIYECFTVGELAGYIESLLG
ncbi:MAG: acyl carrier protein [Oscillospiraceae bacterium]|nr:acyl carrier protein [Oscillospiraceae bacterium]MDR1330310.1 acyl carrier protein [Oscillospiraceae bacterium]